MAERPKRGTKSSSGSAKLTRRSHRKSRNGCKECKRRHMKCDENRPVCVNCSTAKQRCSFVEQVPFGRSTSLSAAGSPPDTPLGTGWPPEPTVALTTSPAPSSASIATTSVLTPVSPASAVPSTPSASFSFTAGTPQDSWARPAAPSLDIQAPFTFNLSHLALLHHLETEMVTAMSQVGFMDTKDAKSMLSFLFNSSISTPYLMDEVLAFAALHLSTLQSEAEAKEQYQRQASELQTRSLELFNSSHIEVDSSNSTTMFVFSSLLGLHNLFDAGSYNGDFTEFLDRFIQYLGLHRGVGAFAGQAWESIRNTEMKNVIGPIEATDRQRKETGTADPENVGSRLMSMLESSSGMASVSHSEACRKAVESLEWVIGMHAAFPSRQRVNIVPAWPIRISSEYIELLKQRRPEALVILAHWAVFLHRDRNFWVFGDTGRTLIECIGRYLGTYWDKWLAWPKEALKIV